MGVLRFLVAMAIFATTMLAAAAESTRTNILLITADDLGPYLGCFGDSQARTPNIDRLAASGMRFDHAWVTQSSCSPSRSSMLTGLYPHQNGQIGIGQQYRMKPGVLTLPGLLKSAGYRTGLIGKYHVLPAEPMPWDVLHEVGEFPDKHDPNHYVRLANEFLDSNTSSPFFLMVNLTDPHKPFQYPAAGLPEKPLAPADVTPFEFLSLDTPEIRRDMAGYYNCASRADAGVGLLLDSLSKRGFEQKTLVVFLGDNGPPFTRGKTSCYEAGLRTPLLIRWPGNTKPGSCTKALVSTVDLLPTFLEVGGVQMPGGLPGKSLIPLLKHGSAPWRDTLFGEHNVHVNYGYFPRRAIRDQRYKLIMNLLSGRYTNPTAGIDGCPALAASRTASGVPDSVRKAYERLVSPPAVELYDLEKDPHEFVNLAEDQAYAQQRQRLLGELRKWREATNDPLLQPAELDRMARERDTNTSRKPRKPKKTDGTTSTMQTRQIH